MQRAGMLLLTWLAAASAVLGQQVAPRPKADQARNQETCASTRVERVEHMLKAADHLEAAGLTDQADRVRAQIQQEKAALAERLKTLEADVERLRGLLDQNVQVLVDVKVVEIDRSKLRALGFDFAKLSGPGKPRAAQDDLFTFELVDNAAQLNGLLHALRKDRLARVLAEPTLVTASGRPAAFHAGGEFPVLKRHPDGTVSVEYRSYGTQIDFVAVVLRGDKLRLELRPRISEIDTARSVEIEGQAVPGLRVREIDTGVEMRSGQTLVVGGLMQRRQQAQPDEKSKTQPAEQEVELMMLVRPEIVRQGSERLGKIPRPAPR